MSVNQSNYLRQRFYHNGIIRQIVNVLNIPQYKNRNLIWDDRIVQHLFISLIKGRQSFFLDYSFLDPLRRQGIVCTLQDNNSSFFKVDQVILKSFEYRYENSYRYYFLVFEQYLKNTFTYEIKCKSLAFTHFEDESWNV